MQLPLAVEKRKRAANFTEAEKFKFVRILLKYGDVIIHKTNAHDTRTNKLKEEAWKLITRDLNSSGSVKRSIDTLKKLWQKLKSDAKTYKAAAQQEVSGTVDELYPKSINPVLELVIEMLGHASSGKSGVSDCDSERRPGRQNDIIEAGLPSPTPPAADPLFETHILQETDIVKKEAPSCIEELSDESVDAFIDTEELTDESSDAVPLTTITSSRKRRRQNMSDWSLHGERTESARAKIYNKRLASERLRSERAKTELIKLRIKQSMQLHHLKLKSERKLHSLKVQILEKIAKKIEGGIDAELYRNVMEC